MADAAAAPPLSPARAFSLAPQAMLAAVLGLIPVGVGLFNPALFNDGDTLWHLRAGQLMLETGAVLRTDPFTFTFAGAPWTTHEWGAEILSALAYGAGGAGGIAALHAVAAGLAILMVAQRYGGARPLPWALAACLAFGCLIGGFLARPHVLVLPLITAWTILLLDARAAGRAPPVWGALVMLAWTNLHGSFAFGLALAGFFALEALIAAPRAWRRTVWDWGVFGLTALAAAAVTPHGLEGLLFPFKLLGLEELETIREWAPLDWSQPKPAHAAALAALALIAHPRTRPPWTRIALLALLFWMMANHTRHQMLFGLIGALVLAPSVVRLFPGAAAPRRWAKSALGLFLAGAMALIGLRLGLGPAQVPANAIYPQSVIAAMPADMRARPGFNDYALGGALIFEGVRPFIDGRADLVGDAFLRQYDAILEDRPGAVDAAIAAHDLHWALVRPDAPIAAALAARGWRTTAASPDAVLLERSR